MPECHKPFLGHCDLDLWPCFKNYCVQSISSILFDVGTPNLGWWFLLGWQSGAYHFESLWPWHWLLASFLGFSCYITANFPQIRLMLDQFLWGHSSRVCDISCSSISSNICLGCLKELSHWDGSFEYPQHMFWLRNKNKRAHVPWITHLNPCREAGAGPFWSHFWPQRYYLYKFGKVQWVMLHTKYQGFMPYGFRQEDF